VLKRSFARLLGISLLLAVPLRAQQPGSIRGVVTDQDFHAPLAGVRVVNVETGQRVHSSADGNFVFTEVAPGTYTLEFTLEGHERQVRSGVVVKAGQLTDVDVALAGVYEELEEFVVQDIVEPDPGSERSLLELRFSSDSFLDSIGSDLLSRAGASDAAAGIRLVAGASTQNGKTAVIRGLPDRYISSQLNGVRLPTADEDKRAVELDQFPTTVIESIQVSKTFTPDQQGDASGGAVNVVLEGVPEEQFFVRFKTQAGYNSQVRQRDDFLTYDGGGVTFWGDGGDRLGVQTQNIGSNWQGAVGVDEGEAPTDYKFSIETGGRFALNDDVTIGGSISFFHENDSSYYDGGIDDSYWIEKPGAPLTPRTTQGNPSLGEFNTALYDVTQGRQSVQWGGLGTLGLETERDKVTLAYLYVRSAEDTATLLEDTRGKQHFFPGFDPNDPTSPGFGSGTQAPFQRLETLSYTERTTDSLQLHGDHKLPLGNVGGLLEPEIDWTAALSSASSNEPDKRIFGSKWTPGTLPGTGTHSGLKPAQNINLGNLQRVFEEIEEKSQGYALNVKVPFEQWTDDEGYVKVGGFFDHVERKFDQDTFSNRGDEPSFSGPFEQRWSAVFPFENHPILESTFDVDYEGKQEIGAYYGMLDLPLTSFLSVVGGARVEATEISIRNQPEPDALWFDPETQQVVQLTPGAADVSFSQTDVLPALGAVLKPIEDLTLRASYSETVARQTFKELTPIQQQEYAGGPVFIGNPNLKMAALQNYDLRADFVPYDGALFSASWFKKDIRRPIEYVQRITTFDFTTAVNYPSGRLEGFELEARQDLGQLLDPLTGLSVGANATFISSDVVLPADESAEFSSPMIQAPLHSRDMTGAPEHLYNLYLTYDLAPTQTRFGVFYTVTGDTLVTGADAVSSVFVPSVYALEYDTLNVSVSQGIGDLFKLEFQAKNLTNPNIKTVYRSEFIDDDVTKTSFSRGIDYSLSIGGEITF
jgi:outer membrane receptor protein involved in Fe transport